MGGQAARSKKYGPGHFEPPCGDIAYDGGRSLVEEPLDELHERLGILKARIRIQASDDEELPVALAAPAS